MAVLEASNSKEGESIHMESEPVTISRIVTKEDRTSTWEMRRARLVLKQGPDSERTVALSPDGIVIGTSPECDLVLTDNAVSRRHLRIKPVDSGFSIEDLGSKNGTFMQSVRIIHAIASGGQTIEIGHTQIALELENGTEVYPLSASTHFGSLLGKSLPMRRAFAVLERAAESDASLLIEGESGTGKDLAAETVHAMSSRSQGPLVIVDCGAIPPNLAESELFGHIKGAFTGAEKERVGAFQSADGGTIFLDEIGELDPSVQPKLLRVLEKHQVKKVGENTWSDVNVRIMAATNRDLTMDVESGKFRSDLYYRLSVLKVHLPPLRDRPEDIAPIAKSLVTKLKPDADAESILSPSVKNMLVSHHWPGNVRELRNVMERLLLFPDWPDLALDGQKHQSRGPASDELASPLFAMPFHEAKRVLTEEFEKKYLSRILEDSDWVVSKAAQRAGIPRQTIHRLMTKLDITRKNDQKFPAPADSP